MLALKQMQRIRICCRCLKSRWYCWCWDNTIKNSTCFISWLYSLFMNRLPSSIQWPYERLLYYRCCSLEIIYQGMPHWSIPNFAFFPKHISTSTIQCQHFFVFFAFYQWLDETDWPQDTSYREALNAFLSDMKWLCYSGSTYPLYLYPFSADWMTLWRNFSGGLQIIYKTQDKISTKVVAKKKFSVEIIGISCISDVFFWRFYICVFRK